MRSKSALGNMGLQITRSDVKFHEILGREIFREITEIFQKFHEAV